MFRYNFNKKNVDIAKQFLEGKGKTEPSFLKNFKGSIKDGQLYLDDKQVVPKEDGENYLRKRVLSGRVPMSRDGLYYYLQTTNVVGISRAQIDKFLKAQNIIRETDNAQPRTNKTSRRVLKKGILSFDLIEINWRDLGFTPTDKGSDESSDEDTGHTSKSRYIFSCVDALTGLVFIRFSRTKKRKAITPIAKMCFKYFVKTLGLESHAKLFATSDKGSEFDFAKYKKWGVRTKQLVRANRIEVANSHIQRVLFRVSKMGLTKSIKTLVKNTMDIVNRTQSSLTKVTPIQAAKMKNSELAPLYNKKRGQNSGVKIKSKPLKLGDMVRLNLIGPKKTSFFKAYKPTQWSKRSYEVLTKKANKYKINGPKGKKFYHRDDLRLTSKGDKKTTELIAARKKEMEEKEAREVQEIRKKVDEDYLAKAKKFKRAPRKGAIEAMKKYRAMVDREKRRDKTIGS